MYKIKEIFFMNLIISIGQLLKFQVVGYIYSYVISRRGIVQLGSFFGST